MNSNFPGDTRYAIKVNAVEENPRGFVRYPVALWNALSPEQATWQQQLYQRAWATAMEAMARPLRRPDFPREARN